MEAERQLLEIREEMNIENRYRFDEQRARRQQQMDKELIELGSRRLQLQSLPIGQPDTIPKRIWAKAKTHGRANTRALTANELAERRQRQEAREQAEQARIQEQEEQDDFIYTPEPFDSQNSTISVAPARSIRP